MGSLVSSVSIDMDMVPTRDVYNDGARVGASESISLATAVGCCNMYSCCLMHSLKIAWECNKSLTWDTFNGVAIEVKSLEALQAAMA